MEVQYINQYDITVSLLRQWSRHPVTQKAKNARRKGLTLRIAGCVASIVVIFGSILTNDTSFMIIGGLFLAIFLFRLCILPELALKKQYEQGSRTIGGDDWKRCITFGDDIIVVDGRNTQRYYYAELIEVTEDNACFYLIMGSGVALRIGKDSFTLGTVGGFRDFIKGVIAKNNKKYGSILK